MSLPKRLKLLRMELELTQQALADMLGIQKQRISDLETGKIKKLTSEEVLTLHNKYYVDSSWLVTGEGTMFRDNSYNEKKTNPHYGTMSISDVKANFTTKDEIQELIALLPYAPPTYIVSIKKKLKKFKQLIDE
jgi:transcriptional regulator with XRE-family HTH domain